MSSECDCYINPTCWKVWEIAKSLLDGLIAFVFEKKNNTIRWFQLLSVEKLKRRTGRSPGRRKQITLVSNEKKRTFEKNIHFHTNSCYYMVYVSDVRSSPKTFSFYKMAFWAFNFEHMENFLILLLWSNEESEAFHRPRERHVSAVLLHIQFSSWMPNFIKKDIVVPVARIFWLSSTHSSSQSGLFFPILAMEFCKCRNKQSSAYVRLCKPEIYSK